MNVFSLFERFMDTKNILIVESDLRAAVHVEQMFTGLPVEVHFARSRAEAHEVGMRCTFSLCFIAHGLIDGSGLQLLREIFDEGSPVVGVLTSRHPDLWVIQQAFDAGYAAVLSQPPDAGQLSVILRRVIGEAAAEWTPGVDSVQSAGLQPARNLRLSEIANLSNSDIRERLSNSDLIGIIRSVEYPFAGKERLEYFDRDTLERVVCLVRRWSQQRLERLRSERALDSVGLKFAGEAVAVWPDLAVAS